VVQVGGKFQDTKVLCNSADYLALLAKPQPGSKNEYTLIFETTYQVDEEFKGMMSPQDGKYCTAMWEVVELLRKNLQVDGVYEKLPSACSGDSGKRWGSRAAKDGSRWLWQLLAPLFYIFNSNGRGYRA
jgi:hypothetical protein